MSGGYESVQVQRGITYKVLIEDGSGCLVVERKLAIGRGKERRRKRIAEREA